LSGCKILIQLNFLHLSKLTNLSRCQHYVQTLLLCYISWLKYTAYFLFFSQSLINYNTVLHISNPEGYNIIICCFLRCVCSFKELNQRRLVRNHDVSQLRFTLRNFGSDMNYISKSRYASLVTSELPEVKKEIWFNKGLTFSFIDQYAKLDLYCAIYMYIRNWNKSPQVDKSILI
jgi:hypothetical protein